VSGSEKTPLLLTTHTVHTLPVNGGNGRFLPRSTWNPARSEIRKQGTGLVAIPACCPITSAAEDLPHVFGQCDMALRWMPSAGVLLHFWADRSAAPWLEAGLRSATGSPWIQACCGLRLYPAPVSPRLSSRFHPAVKVAVSRRFALSFYNDLTSGLELLLDPLADMQGWPTPAPRGSGLVKRPSGG